jgi:hypothetical protein
MTTDVNVQVTVGAPANSEPDYAPSFREKVADRGQVAGEVLAVFCGLVFAVWCVLGRLLSLVAEWRAARRQARRVVIVVPVETDAWMRAYATRTGCELGAVVHAAIAAARAPEAVAALHAIAVPTGPIVVRMPARGGGAAAMVIEARDPPPPSLPRVFDRALEVAVRRLEP